MTYLIQAIHEDWGKGTATLTLIECPDPEDDHLVGVAQYDARGTAYECSIEAINTLMQHLGLDDPSEYTPHDLVGKVVDMEMIWMSQSVIYRLRRIAHLLSINALEKELGMPSGTLAKAISGQRKLPKKWEAKLKDFLNTF